MAEKEKPSWYEWVEKAPLSKEEELRLYEKETNEYLTINQVRSMKIQDELDLHGVIKETAQKMIHSFLSASKKAGLIKINIIFGKGIHSSSGLSILEEVVKKEISQSTIIRESYTPKAKDGGSGALTIILKNSIIH
ncbi:MAG: Smr/MutS family protein [Sphaerochaetaceae bacterium]|nr:Smr/MutS family protein [Sphaerochaetaceae bacterium]